MRKTERVISSDFQRKSNKYLIRTDLIVYCEIIKRSQERNFQNFHKSKRYFLCSMHFIVLSVTESLSAFILNSK